MSTLLSRRGRAKIGADDNGRRMSLVDFERAATPEGLTVELSRGVIEVGEIPSRTHALVSAEVERQFRFYEVTQPGIIQYQSSGASTKVLIHAYESVRHADWSVYLTPMPPLDQPWSEYVPEIVIEIVSESSIRRDYVEKPAEYLALGVREYWIVDPIRSHVLVKSNVGGLWNDQTYKPGQKIKTLRLPKLAFDVRRAFAAAK